MEAYGAAAVTMVKIMGLGGRRTILILRQMTDRQIIKEIGKKLGDELILSESTSINSIGYCYSLNKKRKVTGLSLIHLQDQGIYTGLRMNNLDDLITSIAKLDNLTYLNLSGNRITNIDSLGKLRNIIYLDLSENNITKIDPIGNLKQLLCLNLSENKVTDITPLIKCNLISTLFLQNNKIQEIPFEIFNFIFLKKNRYDVYEIRFIKECLVQAKIWEAAALLRDLEKILEKGEDAMKKRFIEGEDIINKRFRDLFNYMIVAFIKGNPLSNPPLEIVQQGENALKNYFNQIKKEKGKTEFLFESKLLVIGEGGTGKTTLIRKIRDVHAEMPREQDTTFGIEVGKWSFVTEFPNIPELGKVKFHVNLWDFGGQKIYQGTHQIFFTDKSFYVLVADTREQKTDFAYWLNTVEQLGGDNSSIIIVLNKKFGHEQKFDESGYENHFGNLIKEVIQIDLKNETNKIYELQDKIKMYLKQFPGIGDALPPSWVKIREELSKVKANFISFDQFREICFKYDISDNSLIQTLTGYFNRIGAFTHYSDDQLLQERIYINSNWLVKTVYEVLDNEIAKSKKGRLTGSEIKTIWSKNELQYEINKLTQLMHKFGLMYHIEDSDNYVVPAHLPTVRPYRNWKHAHHGDILKFIYEFDKYMPQGIMSRLIIALYHHIKDHSLVWHRGVNIESNGAYAEIIETYELINHFEIRVVGANKIELLSIIRERFAEVLKPFNKLKYRQLVPCICKECKNSIDPAFHEYNELLKFREMKKGSQCTKTGEIIWPEELLKISEMNLQAQTNYIQEKKIMTTIKIFLASSSELSQERKTLREFISIQNDQLHEKGIYLKLIQWESFIDAMSKERLQAEYNKALKECDIFLSLFFTKVGKYTAEEFEYAFGQFNETGKPYIYTYFKDASLNSNEIIEQDIKSKFKFEKKLKKLGHFKTIYKDINDLENQFKRQLESLIPKLLATSP